jgi:glycosyltransferase involved in cell wall biosynthesis
LTYSGQFLDVCRDLGAEGYLIAYHPRRELLRHGAFTIEHRPITHLETGGLGFLIGQWRTAIGYVFTARRFGADAVVATDSQGAWAPLRLLRLFGIRLIPSVHCALWPVNSEPRAMKRLFFKLEAGAFRKPASAVLCVSRGVARQVRELTKGRHAPILEFVPNYRNHVVERIDGPPAARKPFRVLYAGRIERYKGLFELLDIAKRFDGQGRNDIEFDLCGDGAALEELKRHADAAGVASRFRVHGHLSRPRMREMHAGSHVVLVPTTSEFVEGINKVVVEGVLAGRPVITSSVCGATEYVSGAVEEVPTDDTGAYGDAILRLCDDRTLYDRRRAACATAATQFYDRDRGWAAALKRALSLAGVGG